MFGINDASNSPLMVMVDRNKATNSSALLQPALKQSEIRGEGTQNSI